MLEGTAKHDTASEKGKSAWALGASLKGKVFQREGIAGATSVIAQKY